MTGAGTSEVEEGDCGGPWAPHSGSRRVWLQAGRAACHQGKEDWEGGKLKSGAGAFPEGRLPEISKVKC